MQPANNLSVESDYAPLLLHLKICQPAMQLCYFGNLILRHNHSYRFNRSKCIVLPSTHFDSTKAELDKLSV